MPKIKPLTFYIGLVAFLIMPLLFKSNMLLTGKTTDGTFVTHRWFSTQNGGTYKYAVFQYTINDIVYCVVGPVNVIYTSSEKVRILYDPYNPGDSMVYSLSSIYLRYSTLITAFLLMVWAAYYSTYTVKKRKVDSRNPSPGI